jgi:hypothetical protein
VDDREVCQRRHHQRERSPDELTVRLVGTANRWQTTGRVHAFPGDQARLDQLIAAARQTLSEVATSDALA